MYYKKMYLPKLEKKRKNSQEVNQIGIFSTLIIFLFTVSAQKEYVNI